MKKTNASNACTMQLFEFVMGGHSYGVNALRIVQIIQYNKSKLTPIPGSSPVVLGTVIFQEQSIPIIDLPRHLGLEGRQNQRFQTVIICEINHQKVGFLIDDVRNMSTIQVDDIQQRRYSATQEGNPVMGIIHREGRQIVLPDFQEIVLSLFGIEYSDMSELRAESWNDFKGIVYLADDSSSIRAILGKIFEQVAFENYHIFESGRLMLEALQEFAGQEGDLAAAVPLVITDQEMPGLDGLGVCREVKSLAPTIQVVMMSSLISPQLIDKGRQAGVDQFIGKDELGTVVEVIRKLTQKRNG